jgi:hypothetical protein
MKERMKMRDDVLPVLREVSNVYTFQKDRKVYDPDAPPKIMRK